MNENRKLPSFQSVVKASLGMSIITLILMVPVAIIGMTARLFLRNTGRH